MADEEIPPERTFPARDPEAAQRRAREEQRQFFIDGVWNDVMTPSEAELLATGAGVEFEDATQPVTIGSPKWSLAQAVVWIAWRDPNRIQEQWRRLHAWSGSLWRDPPAEHQAESFEQAEALLWDALEAGRVHATGLLGQGPRPVQIEALEWSNLVWMPDHTRLSVCYFGQPDPAYRCVDVKSADMLAVWPTPSMQPPAANPAAPTVSEKSEDWASKRNKGGAPQKYDWDAMWIEVVRLADAEQIPDRPTLSRHLLAWFVEQTGSEPGDTVFKQKMAKLFDTLGWN